MDFRRILVRNARTVLSNPAMVPAYARWLLGLLIRDMTVTTRFGARLGGFENFSNYWGTVRKIPNRDHFDFFASFLVGRHAICFDIGANIGSFAVLLGKRSPGSCIHAFEPAPSTCAILRTNIERNQLTEVRAHQIAVADQDGIVCFSNEPSISQRNRILSGMERAIACSEVPATSLDSFCATNNIERVGFMKIDCEGAEPLVLRGARTLLAQKRIAAVLIEVCPRNLRAFSFCLADLVAQVENTSYVFHRLTEFGAVGERLTQRELAKIQSEDVLLLPR